MKRILLIMCLLILTLTGCSDGRTTLGWCKKAALENFNENYGYEVLGTEIKQITSNYEGEMFTIIVYYENGTVGYKKYITAIATRKKDGIIFSGKIIAEDEILDLDVEEIKGE